MIAALRKLSWCLLLGSWQTLALAAQTEKAPVFDVRLLTPLSSVTSSPGTAVKAVVASPAVVDGRVVLPVGAIVAGKVAGRSKVGLGLVRERAMIDLRFDEFQLPDGSRFPMRASVVTIDNAREEVTRDGQIRGILAADFLPTYVFGVWHRVSSEFPHRAVLGLTGASGMAWLRLAPGPVGAAGMLGLRFALVPWPDPEISLPPGTEIRLRLESIDEGAPASPVSKDEAIEEDLRNDLSGRPFQLASKNREAPADIINFLLVGTRLQVMTAFQAAGWLPADVLNRRSFREGYRAYTSVQGYPTAPVSQLQYRGEEPHHVFQKSFNTITKRHHIRMWDAGRFKDQDLWLGAASHDIGVDFNPIRMSVAHRIDSRIDLERAKVINDLSFCGCLQRIAYVDRPAVVSYAAVNRKEKIETDGRAAVLFLQECSPAFPIPSDVPGKERRPNLSFRLAQRTFLEARNYLFRRNIYYQSYRAISRVLSGSRKTAGQARDGAPHNQVPDGKRDLPPPGLSH